MLQVARLNIKAIKSTTDNPEEILKSLRIYENFCNGANITDAERQDIFPDRNDFALLYRYLKSNNGYDFPFETLVHKLDNKLSFGKIRVILKAMSELGLIEICEGLKSSQIKLIEVTGKVDLDSARIISKLKGV